MHDRPSVSPTVVLSEKEALFSSRFIFPPLILITPVASGYNPRSSMLDPLPFVTAASQPPPTFSAVAAYALGDVSRRRTSLCIMQREPLLRQAKERHQAIPSSASTHISVSSPLLLAAAAAPASVCFRCHRRMCSEEIICDASLQRRCHRCGGSRIIFERQQLFIYWAGHFYFYASTTTQHRRAPAQ